MKRISGQLPVWAKLEIRREGKRGDMCSISYEEGFAHGYEELVAKTLEGVKALEPYLSGSLTSA